MPLGNLQAFNDWDLLDMAEGLQHPTTVEREMAKRFRLRLEAEREARFKVVPCLPPAFDITDCVVTPSDTPGIFNVSCRFTPIR